MGLHSYGRRRLLIFIGCRYGDEKCRVGEGLTVETTAGIVTGKRISQRLYKIRLNDPTTVKLDYPVDVDGVKIMTAYLSGTTADALRTMCERVRDKAPNVVAALVGSSDGKLTLAVTCGKNVLGRGLKSGVLAKKIAMLAGGNGGGKPDFAMAGLKDATKVDEALNAVQHFIDDAILVGMSRVRILHGKGNGILRTLIRQYLDAIPNVISYRDEHVQFGGAGITVVELA